MAPDRSSRSRQIAGIASNDFDTPLPFNKAHFEFFCAGQNRKMYWPSELINIDQPSDGVCHLVSLANR
jgi:hypothetical protein